METAQAVLRVVTGRATLPVLGGIRITATKNDVEFAGTDLEMFLRVEADNVSVEEEGSVIVPGRLFGEIIRSLPSGRVSVSGSESEIRVQGGRSEFSLNGLPLADFPELPELPEGSVTRLGGSELAKALRQVVRGASTDEARPVLTGVLWSLEGGALRLAATDSYRLAVREVAVKEGPDSGSAIVPGRALGEFGRHLAGVGDGGAEIKLGESQAEFSAGRTRLLTRLIEGEFPNYRQLLPEGYPNKLKAPREALLAAVERIGLVVQANTPVKLHLEDEVRLTAVESGIAEGFEVVEGAEYHGEPMVTAFNPRFLADGLEAIESELVALEVSNPLERVVLKGDDREDFIYLIMPVRLPR